jgi:hypothetical protein
MGNIIRGHMILMSIVTLAFLIVSGRKVSVRIRIPQQFDVHFDTKFTDSAKFLITSFINTLDKRVALYPAVLVLVIKKQFPFIQTVNTRLVPPGTMKLACMAEQPLCAINHNFLLLPTPCICSADYYCQEVWSSLPQISVDQTLLATCEPGILVSLMKKLNKDIFADYQISVSADSSLVFEDKAQPRLSMLCRIDDVPVETLCMHGKNMRELLENRNAFNGKSNNQFVADLRFQKQIILTKK